GVVERHRLIGRHVAGARPTHRRNRHGNLGDEPDTGAIACVHRNRRPTGRGQCVGRDRSRGHRLPGRGWWDIDARADRSPCWDVGGRGAVGRVDAGRAGTTAHRRGGAGARPAITLARRCAAVAQAMMLTPPSTYIVVPVRRRAYGVARYAQAKPTSTMSTRSPSGARSIASFSITSKSLRPDAARVLRGPGDTAC